MIGQSKEALRLLQDSKEKLSQFELSVLSTSLDVSFSEKVSALSVTLINQVAVKLCENDILGAKDQIDEMLAALDLKLVIQAGNNQLIPQYLINTLVYFFLKTSKSSDFY